MFASQPIKWNLVFQISDLQKTLLKKLLTSFAVFLKW